ncbi:acyl-CoA carboxylase epsilon subunit [Streptomyces sp. NPDC048349]|uniref:acyl-CoA carboxylase epsilon subunit n=1 Tax=Streptomyces sp. NPDC048349 TaxID=3155486 RepID=UPI003422FF59
MIIVEERPLPTAPAVRVPPAGDHPAATPASTDRPAPTDRPHSPSPTGSPERPEREDRPELPGAGAAEDSSLALAMASIRISRGNPTAEETAAIAVLLTARLRRLHEARRPAPSAQATRTLPPAPCPPFRPPGAWAS